LASPVTFKENVVVNKQLTIEGANHGICAANPGAGARGPESIIDGNFTGAAVTILASNVTIDGFEIIHGQNGNNAGVWMSAAQQNMKIINNVVDNNTIGIYANCAGASLIECN